MNLYRAQVLLLTVLVPAVGTAFAGCGSPTACDHAVDKAKSCGFPDAKLSAAGEQCEVYAACTANCMLKASCNDIKATVATDMSNPLGSCVYDCGK